MSWLPAEEMIEFPQVARTAIIYYLVKVLHLEFEEACLQVEEAFNAILTVKRLKLEKFV